jgi:hypothetical protein
MLDKLNAIADYLSKMTADAQAKKKQVAADDVNQNLPDNDDEPSAATKAKKSINKAMNMSQPE